MRGVINIENTAQVRGALQENTRRYISGREIAAYTLYDASKSVTPGNEQRFLYDVFRIDLSFLALVNVINGIWDVINDTFIGYLIDKTRTRWGKFKPYMLAVRLPVALITILKYLAPLFLPQAVNASSKFFVYLGISLTTEGLSTFTSISETGLFAVMSPSPNDRVLLKSRASLLSSLFDNFPRILTSLLMDMVNHQKLHISLTNLFAMLGAVMAMLSLAMSLYYALSVKERVVPSRETPSLKEGLTAVLRNKPLRLLILSDLLNVFTIGTDSTNYFIDVLGYSSLQSLIEAPNIPITLSSYLIVPYFRRKFGTRTLWIFTGHFEGTLNVLIYLYGIIGGTGNGGNYRSWQKMLPALILKDTLRKTQWGLHYVIPAEVLNETLDYCEWKDGYRAEGMILSSKGIVTKLISNSFSWVGATVLKEIGYSVGTSFGKQSERVKYLLFFTGYLLPGLTSMVSVIPKLFYNISDETRLIMYAELNERRK